MAFLDYAGLQRFKSKLDAIFNSIKSRVSTLEDNEILYTESYTEGAVAAKTATIADFTLKTGRYVAVKFTNTNTAENPTLNISNTGAKPIYNAGQAMPPNMLTEDNIYIFRYNGSQYDVMSASGSGGSGAFMDIPFTILASAWTLTNNVYIAEVLNNLVTVTAGIQVSYDESIRYAIAGDIFEEKGIGKVIFKTYKQPVGDLSGFVRIFDGIRQIVNGVAPIEVGGTGGATAVAARANLHVPAVESIADPYNSSETYNAGARVIHDNKVYRCSTKISVAEEWNADHWIETTIDDELNLLSGSVESVKEDLGKTVKSVNNILPNDQGEVDINHVTYADNLVADDAQSSSGVFIERTTGGDASLSDGDAWLSKIRGSSVHTGYVAQSVNMTIELGEREPTEEPITAVINDDTFIAAMISDSGTKVFTYTTEWSESPENFGITISGDAVSGDKITVVYQKENRGTIFVSSPTSFVSTGWNLYNHSVGYAHVLKYSDTHGFLIGGTYSAVQFSETLEGEKTTITPVDGFFDISKDGYVWVTGGNSTDTYILMTWSDWTNGYEGSFQTYTESTINIESIMENFPHGLMQVGAIRDEIDFNLSIAYSNIEQLVYSETNLEIAKSSGRAYECDTYYIYLVRETPIAYEFSVNGAYIAYDHGIEFVTGTTLPVYVEMLYGQNLKDKLRTDVVTKSSDIVNTLTSTATDKALSAAQGKVLSDGKINTSAIANNLTTTAAGYVLDARQGKELNTAITNKLKRTVLLNNVAFTGSSSTTWNYSGQSFKLTKDSFVYLTAWFSANPCYGIGFSSSSSSFGNELGSRVENSNITTHTMLTWAAAGTYYVWVKVSGRCNGHVFMFDL